jgi:hypothetical protein
MTLCLSRQALKNCNKLRRLSTLPTDDKQIPFQPRVLTRTPRVDDSKTILGVPDLLFDSLSLGPRLDSAQPVASFSLHAHSPTSLEPIYNDFSRLNRYHGHTTSNKELGVGYKAFRSRFKDILREITRSALGSMTHTVRALAHAGKLQELRESDIIASEDIIRG